MKRYNFLDAIRGLAVVNMVLYHFLFDLVEMENIKIDWFVSTPGVIWERFICITFIVVSGFCFNLSKNKKKQILTLSVVAILLSVATFLFDRDLFIVFGIIHLLALSCFLTVFVDKLKADKKILFVVSIILFIITYNIVKSPMNISTNAFSFIGFYNNQFASGDYFPMIPWSFLYLVGYSLYHLVDINFDIRENFLCTIGKKSLIIYLLHQPIILLIIQIIKLLGGFYG